MPDPDNNPSRDPAGEATARLASIVTASDDAIISQDLSGTITAWNSAAEAMFGWSPAEVLGQPVTRIIPRERFGEETNLRERILAGEWLVRLETERLNIAGGTIPVSIAASPIHDEQGRIAGISKVLCDLTGMYRVLHDLRRREALLEAILNTVPDALIVMDVHGIIQSFNAGAERIFGHIAAAAIGQNVSMLIPAPYRTEHDHYVGRYLETGERRMIGIGRILTGLRADGAVFPMELEVGEAIADGERLFIGFIRDLTARQERERRVTELQAQLIHVTRLEELGHLFAALIHEVNQPLAAMTNYLNGARRLIASGNVTAAAEAIERIAEQLERSRQTLQRQRDFARNGETVKQVDDLHRTIEEAVALALLGVGTDVKLAIRIDREAREARFDRVQVQQVLMNLIRNAVETMAASARRDLTISTAVSGEMVEIRVEDTGPGVPAELNVFAPFVTTKPAGMGVGLAVSRGIVEAHGGELRAEDREGGGTVFCFTLPRPDTDATA